MSEEELREPGLKRGFYLATIAHCMECHARRPCSRRSMSDLTSMRERFGFGIVSSRNKDILRCA
jgi:hypothetical protein